MTRKVSVILVFVCQIGLSIQACAECACCKGSDKCASNKNCVDGCIDGYYSNKCTEQCLENCKTCINGNECTECIPGYYTNKCNFQCGKGCLNSTCSLLSGKCPCKSVDFVTNRCDVCLGLKYGAECNKTCPSNCGSCISDTECSWCKYTAYYGSYCQYNCSVGCVNGTCHKSTGHCISGCKHGFVGEFCNNTCKDGTYGESCSKSCKEIDPQCQACSTNELGSYGNCTKCESGFYPVIPYRFAYLKCAMCPYNCKDNVCDATGLCLNGCVQGKWGRKCNTDCKLNCVECDQNDATCLECSRGTFANNCSLKCSTYCNNDNKGQICAMGTGRCLQGCKLSTNYGEFCEEQCSDTCINKSCDLKTGHCKVGCALNYYGSFCDKTCADACQSNENKRICDDINGNCLYACKDGFHGKMCNSICDGRCLNTTCNQITGNCLNGCIHGFKGPKCVEAVQPGQEGHTTGTLIGSIAGSLVAGGIIVGVAGLVAFIVWRRRHVYSKQAGLHGYENTSRHGEYGPNDNAHESDSPATYEYLKSRDERLYSQITTSQQISQQAADYGITVDTMTRLVSVILVLVCQIGLSMQACNECACCKGSHNCDSNNNCVDGCIDGYYGNKCTEECLENCKTCVNGNECTECIPGYYANKCNLQCGKGCLDNTCSLSSGECVCKSSYFTGNKCDVCAGSRYGDECNYTCPSSCGHCISDTECSWCINTVYYGDMCQYSCSVGCVKGKCNKGTGHCIDGCKTGFSGYKCDTCSPGLHGLYCDLNCPENCLTCLSTTNCSNCKSGFYGEACTKTCPTGCDRNCSLIGGRCSDCKPGFNGEYCNFTCRNETYGANCSKLCRYVDKHCYACISNESGIYGGCTTCDRGYYPVSAFGYNQSICTNCPDNCKGNICDTTGLCNVGCIQGFNGPTCAGAIQLDQEGHTTGTLIGSILGSFVAGCIIVGVTALIAFVVWRRRFVTYLRK